MPSLSQVLARLRKALRQSRPTSLRVPALILRRVAPGLKILPRSPANVKTCSVDGRQCPTSCLSYHCQINLVSVTDRCSDLGDLGGKHAQLPQRERNRIEMPDPRPSRRDAPACSLSRRLCRSLGARGGRQRSADRVRTASSGTLRMSGSFEMWLQHIAETKTIRLVCLDVMDHPDQIAALDERPAVAAARRVRRRHTLSPRTSANGGSTQDLRKHH